MVERYARAQMKNIWNEHARYNAWLTVEKAAIKAWNQLGLIDDESCHKICTHATFNIERINIIEQDTKHDVIAFLTSVAETLGDESRFVHYGLTSSDIIDTALALQIRESLELIIKGVNTLLHVLHEKANEHKNTLMVGRSHGIHGEPISFGFVLAQWYSDIENLKKALQDAIQIISVGKFSGAMGNFAHAPLEFEEIACKELGLKAVPISSQVISRERHAQVICVLALLANSCEKIALNIRHFQRTEVYEVEEYFNANQKGSSAMPHKRNPVLSENVTGLCRMIRSFVIPSFENVALWHERDISHSSVERFMFPDIFITSDFMLHRLANIVEKLVIYPENMLKNLNLTGGLVFSQRILLELPKKGLSREESYKIIQRNAMKVWEDLQKGKSALNAQNESLFLQYLLKDEILAKVLTEEEIRSCFEYSYYLKNIDLIFKRVFG